jgi:hypothetical protein
VISLPGVAASKKVARSAVGPPILHEEGIRHEGSTQLELSGTGFDRSISLARDRAKAPRVGTWFDRCARCEGPLHTRRSYEGMAIRWQQRRCDGVVGAGE